MYAEDRVRDRVFVLGVHLQSSIASHLRQARGVAADHRDAVGKRFEYRQSEPLEQRDVHQRPSTAEDLPLFPLLDITVRGADEA